MMEPLHRFGKGYYGVAMSMLDSPPIPPPTMAILNGIGGLDAADESAIGDRVADVKSSFLLEELDEKS